MKKIIPLILAFLLFIGCSPEKQTPVINADFSLCAVYKTGDFSYSCKIVKKGETVSVIPSSTSAKGLVISCNGKEVTLKRKTFVKTFLFDEIDKTNPAVILYQVFSSLDSAQNKLIDDKFTYTGNCSLGKYILTQNKDNSFKTLTIPQAEIEINFSQS